MSRRNDTPVPEFNHARNLPPPKAAPKAVQAPPDAKAEILTPPEPPPPPLPKGQYFPTKAELDAALADYMKAPGKCPLCNCKIGRGIQGHLSKCLRSLKFKTASTPTS